MGRAAGWPHRDLARSLSLEMRRSRLPDVFLLFRDCMVSFGRRLDGYRIGPLASLLRVSVNVKVLERGLRAESFFFRGFRERVVEITRYV